MGRSLLGLVAAALLGAGTALAQPLAIGLAATPTSMDPHYHVHAPSYAVQRHIFEPLITRSAELHMEPGLAQSWAPLPGGDGWEFRLDPAARFADGTAVTAADVAASLQRALTMRDSPARLSIFLAEITSVEILDPLTLRLRTQGPAPLVPLNLTALLVAPAAVLANATTADFNAGRVAIGSGPYRLRHYAAREEVVLERRPGWWGGAAAWDRVRLRVISNDAARVAALLAGDVDLIEAVPPHDAARLAALPGFNLAERPSLRLIYLALQQGEVVPPGLLDHRGAPPARNPLQDIRVRRALSLAINRAAIVARVMEGRASIANQLHPAGFPAHDPALPPAGFDLAEARRLLAEAGWGQGFRLVLGGPNDRLVNDERILQAVAQMWQQVGVQAQVEAMPAAMYLPRFLAGGFPATLATWTGGSTEPNNYVSGMLATRDAARGRGVQNPTGYANPVLDQLLDQALSTAEDVQRQAIWHQVARLAMVKDVAVLPLHHQVASWALRRGVAYAARADELTLAFAARPVTPP